MFEPLPDRPAHWNLAPPQTSGLAIFSFIVVFFIPPLGAILGHVSRSEDKRNGRQPCGLALASVVIGWTFCAIVLMVILLAVIGGASHS